MQGAFISCAFLGVGVKKGVCQGERIGIGIERSYVSPGDGGLHYPTMLVR